MNARPYRLLVTGHRVCTGDQVPFVIAYLTGWLAPITDDWPGVIVVHGKCPYGGVDLVAHQWAEATAGCTPEPHPAARDNHGRFLGPERNAEMVAAGADACLAFPGPGSRGTWDCVRQASEAHIPTHIWMLPPTGRSHR